MANEQLDKLLDDINSQLDTLSSQVKQAQDSIIKQSLNKIQPEFAFIGDVEGGKSLYTENTITFSLNYKVSDLKIPCAVSVKSSQSTATKLGIEISQTGIVILIPKGLLDKFNVDATNFGVIRYKLAKDTLVKFNDLTDKITQELRETFYHIVLKLESNIKANSEQIALNVIEQHFPEFDKEILNDQRAIKSGIRFKRETTNKLQVPNIDSLEIDDIVKVNFVKGQYIIITVTMSTEVIG